MKAFVSYWEHRPRMKVIEMVDFVGVMEACTDFEIEGLVVGKLLVVGLGDFRWCCVEESGGLGEVEPFAFEVALACVGAVGLDLIP